MMVVVWYVPETNTIRYAKTESIKLYELHQLPFASIPSEVAEFGRIRLNRDIEDILINLYLHGVGEIALLRDSGIDRFAFLYDESDLERLIKVVPELGEIINYSLETFHKNQNETQTSFHIQLLQRP